MSTSPSSEFTDSRYAETMAGPRAEYSKEQQDIALAAVALQSGVLSERQLASAMATWTIHGSVPLADHLRTLNLIDDAQQAGLSQRAAQRLVASQGDLGDENGSGSKSALLGTLDAIDPAGTVARLMGIRAAAGTVAVDATGGRSAGARYRLVRKLGQGGLGRVWLAYDEILKRHVAVKEICTTDNASALERFRREAEITGRLEHPGIVPIYQLGDDDQTGEAFYVMRFLGKTTLQDSIAEYHERRNDGEHNPMLIRRLLTDFVAVCQAIGHAHSRKVIHRDLKPENIAIDSFGQVIVIDWGIAKVIDEFHAGDSPAATATIVGNRSTMDGQVLGTPLYMAPEQAAGRVDDLDERTDIYGLGAVLYAILTGYAPHERTRAASGAATGRDLIAAISSRPTPNAVEANPSVDRALAAICAKAMARRQYARYQSASELADEVQRWMAGEPVSAYRERPLQRVARWIAKNRIWSQIIAALLIIGLVTLVTLGIATRHSQLAAHQAMFDDMHGLEREIEVQLTSAADELARNTLFMSVVPSVQAIIDTRQPQGDAPTVGESETVWRARLEQNYEGLLRANDDYMAASYVAVAPEGKSLVLVRVERNAGDAFVRRVPETRLGALADKELFTKTLALPPGETLVMLGQPASQASTRRDLRLIGATPVYDERSGDVFGIVVVELNLLARMIEIVEPLEQRTASITLTDGSGQVLLRDTVEEGLTIDGRNTSIATLIPDAGDFFKRNGAREQFDRADGWLARRVQLDPANPEAQLGIVLQLQD